MDKYRLFNDDIAPLSHNLSSGVSRFIKPTDEDSEQIEGYFVSQSDTNQIQMSPQAMEKIALYFAEVQDNIDNSSSEASARTLALQARLRESRKTNRHSSVPSYFSPPSATATHRNSGKKRTNIAKADFMQAKTKSTSSSSAHSAQDSETEIDLMVGQPGQVFLPSSMPDHEKQLQKRAHESYYRTHAHKRKTFVPDQDTISILRRNYKSVYVKTALTAVATLTGLYLIFGPTFPGVMRQISGFFGKNNKNLAQADQNLSNSLAQNGLSPASEAPKELAVNQVGWINIPAIGVGAPIVEGKDDNAMTYGIWHRPGTGTPLTDSNTVLAGHRYQYVNGPRTFYSLDKVKVGDPVEVKWGEQTFRYKVVRTFVVEKDKMYIEAPTTVPLLTIYTCTPLWTSTNRLVVQATPIT